MPVGVLALVLAAASAAAHALDKCDRIGKEPGQFAESARLEARSRAPVKHLELASGIVLVADTGQASLMPYATERQGTKQVVVPIAFARLSCQMALATYMTNQGVGEQAFQQAATSAAACIDEGKPMRGCLIAFGNELAARFRASLAQEQPDSRRVAEALADQALWQVVQHEYAHHYLRHFPRLASRQVTRIDAEFESDLFAITNGIQAGDPPSAMYYFFDGLAIVEGASRALSTPEYESGTCRALNVENITAYLGIVPLALIDAAGGGQVRFQRSSPVTFRQMLREHFGKAAPTLKPGSCSRIATAALPQTYAEMKQLATRMEADTDLLFATQGTLDNARATRLLNDLAAMASSFQYMDGIASKCIAYLLMNWGWKGRGRSPLMTAVDRMLDDPKVAGNLQAEDLGRIRQAQGAVMLQERTDLPVPMRLERASTWLLEAVRYNPRLADAWMNLAIISFKRGDCALAAEFADRAAETHTPKNRDEKDSTLFFARSMRELASDAQACRSRGTAFHPYPGL